LRFKEASLGAGGGIAERTLRRWFASESFRPSGDGGDVIDVGVAAADGGGFARAFGVLGVFPPPPAVDDFGGRPRGFDALFGLFIFATAAAYFSGAFCNTFTDFGMKSATQRAHPRALYRHFEHPPLAACFVAGIVRADDYFLLPTVLETCDARRVAPRDARALDERCAKLPARDERPCVAVCGREARVVE
jgi:hypothetical protein